MPKVCVFDTETTGLSQREWDWDDPRQPQIIELAWLLADDESGAVIEENAQLVKLLPRAVISPSAQKVHGLTAKDVNETGVELAIVLRHFLGVAREAQIIVAHNLAFDQKVVAANMLKVRITGDVFPDAALECTMLETQRRFKLGKWPKLEEAYELVMRKPMRAPQHRAAADVRTTWDIYRGLKRLAEQPEAVDAPSE